MKFNYHKALITGTAALTALTIVGYWYVFVAGAPQPDAPQAERQTGLTFRVETFMSAAMGGERSYGVVLPPDYRENSTKRYPVIFLLHGGHGGARDLEDKAALTSVLHDLYTQQKLPHSIVITPDGNDRRGSSPFWDPQYYDGPNGNVGTLIGAELAKVVRVRYRTLNQPQFWAIGGLSSGGWGALNIGLHHLNQFSILFSHTGYFIDKSGPQNSPQVLIRQIPEGDRRSLHIYLDAGEADKKYLDSTQSFHQTLDALNVSNLFNIFPGGHGIVGQNVGWNYWHTHLADSLSYVGQQFKANLRSQRHTPHQRAKSSS